MLIAIVVRNRLVEKNKSLDFYFQAVVVEDSVVDEV
jgi:hypothetical protein